MLLSQPPSRQAFYHRKSPPPLGVGPRAPDETVTLQRCLSPPHAADHVADRCSPLIVAIGRSLGSRECSLAELRFRVGRKKILDGTLGGEWWLESLSAPRAAGAGVQSAAIQGAGEKAALAGTHNESLPHFAVVVACHCHPAQMVGPAERSALGAQELYLVRTSPRFELKVQGREICGEGEILGTHVSSHLQ